MTPKSAPGANPFAPQLWAKKPSGKVFIGPKVLRPRMGPNGQGIQFPAGPPTLSPGHPPIWPLGLGGESLGHSSPGVRIAPLKNSPSGPRPPFKNDKHSLKFPGHHVR